MLQHCPHPYPSTLANNRASADIYNRKDLVFREVYLKVPVYPPPTPHPHHLLFSPPDHISATGKLITIFGYYILLLMSPLLTLMAWLSWIINSTFEVTTVGHVKQPQGLLEQSLFSLRTIRRTRSPASCKQEEGNELVSVAQYCCHDVCVSLLKNDSEFKNWKAYMQWSLHSVSCLYCSVTTASN